METKEHFSDTSRYRVIKVLAYLMFMMFAMTTDAVGKIIPEVMKQFDLNMTAAGLLHYGPMIAIALAGMFLGFIADKLGRKVTIVLGLTLFAVNSYLFLAGNTFAFFLSLMIVSGLAIGIFKTGALALIGDISMSTKAHTTTMNMVEGFFGVGAIIGPFLVTYFLSKGVEWKWLYAVAATLCVILILITLFVKFPVSKKSTEEPINLKASFQLLKDKYALGFSLGAFLYVAVESAIYVWMPTLLEGYNGQFTLIATYSLTIFFILRAAGRFLGTWILAHFQWTKVLSVFSLIIFICFLGTLLGGISFAALLLPLSGLFMSVIYPTINSKGISCFPKAKHGSIAGIILFFTAAGAAFGPLAMGGISDVFGHDAKVGFALATVFAGLFFIGAFFNMFFNPSEKRLQSLDLKEYSSTHE